jgi:hypothetical protein
VVSAPKWCAWLLAFAVPADRQLMEARTSIRSDPFMVSEDGHYIGNDGFVVPKNFAEFDRRFPKTVQKFVRLHLEMSESESDQLEGRLNGCLRARLPLFDPERAYGASWVRFSTWVNRLLLWEIIQARKA